MAKYISHLDLLRCFTRSIMRAELPVKYSQGFNPHQKITFSLPLSIGVTSICECVDIDFEDSISDSEIMARLNKTLPPDIRILAVGDTAKNANDIFAAEYDVSLITPRQAGNSDISGIDEFFTQPEVIIMKKTKKKGEQPVNLMEFIKSVSVTGSQKFGDEYAINMTMTLSAGGHGNLKPEIAVNALIDYLTPKIPVTGYNIHRTKILCGSEELPQEFN